MSSRPTDIRGSVQNRPKYIENPKKTYLAQNLLLSSGNMRSGENRPHLSRVSPIQEGFIHPKCDSCNDKREIRFILPCGHKICSFCFEKETFYRSTANRLYPQYFIACSKHDSSKRLFAIQTVHTISCGNQCQYLGLACVGCAQKLKGDCYEMNCRHYVCKECSECSTYCSICRKSDNFSGTILKIAGIQRRGLFNEEVTLEPEVMETKQMFYSKCSVHRKTGVQIACGVTLCMECAEKMAGGELMLSMTGKPDDKEHCVCRCNPIRGKHIISITALKKAVFQIDYVIKDRYGFHCQMACGQQAIMEFLDCGHSFCRKCVLNFKRCHSTRNRKMYGNDTWLTCGKTGCNGMIPDRQLTHVIDKYSIDVATIERTCDFVGKQRESASLFQTKVEATLHEDPLKMVTTMEAIERHDNMDCSNCKRKTSIIWLKKCGHCTCKSCLLKNLDEGRKEFVPTIQDKKVIREILICGIEDCKQMYIVDHFDEFLQDTKRKRRSKEEEKTESPKLNEINTASHVNSAAPWKEFSTPGTDEYGGSRQIKTEEGASEDKQNLQIEITNRRKQMKSETQGRQAREASSKEQLKSEILKDRQNHSISPSTSVMEDTDVKNLKKTLNKTDHTTTKSTTSDVKDGKPSAKTKEMALQEKQNLKREAEEASSREQLKSGTLEDRQNHSTSPSTSVMEETDLQLLQQTLDKAVDTTGTKTISDINYETSNTERSSTKENPLTYIKEKTSAPLCSQTRCVSKEQDLAKRKRESCDNPYCQAVDEGMKKVIGRTFSCKHKLCVVCVSMQQTKEDDVIKCKSPKCTSSEIKPEILGIPNIGLTCYASCVLQVLAQTPGFKDMLSEYCLGREQVLVETVLNALLKNVNVGEERNYVLNWGLMERLMAAIYRIDKSFRRYEENDCHSFIITLLNALMKEDTERITNKGSCPTTLFEARITSRFTYDNCDHIDDVDDQLFYSLLLPVTEDVDTIDDCLRIFFKQEKFTESALTCRECNLPQTNPTTTIRSLQISKAPRILMVQLARFEEVSYGQGFYKELRKTDHRVKFEMTLQVKENYTVTKKELEYELYGVVLHHGSMHGGHYTSYVKKQNTNRWFYCSDSIVREINPDSVLHRDTFRNAYVLFYSRTP